uniref:Uncharacterized protein n=1 Tax=Ditylenchus dipsaci TaxID=166011 RepID=A0A915EKC3_9BILA
MAASKTGAVKTIQEKNGGCKASLQTVVAGNAFTKFKPHDGTCAHNHALDEKAVTLSNIKSNLKEKSCRNKSETDGPTQPRIAVSSASRVSKSKQQCRQKNNPSRSHRKSDTGRGRKERPGHRHSKREPHVHRWSRT